MQVKNLLSLLTVLSVLGFTLQACSNDKDDPVQVAACLKNPSNEWRKALQTHAINSLKANGLTYDVDGSEDENQQSKRIRSFLKKGCDVLIVSPEGEPVQALKEAVAAGVPLIISESSPVDSYAALIQIDNHEIGKSAAAFFNKQPDIRKIALFNVQQDLPSSTGRIEGIKGSLNTHLEYVEIKLENYKAEEGAAAARKLLEEHPDVDAIYAQDDDVALGVLSVLGESEQIKAIVGCGGSKEYFQQIKESGKIRLATTLYSPKALMEAAVKEANAIIGSGKVPENKLVKLGSELVDKENVEEHLISPPY